MDDGRFGDFFEAKAGDFALGLAACVLDGVLFFAGLLGVLGDLIGVLGSGSGSMVALGVELRWATRTGVLRAIDGDSALEIPPRKGAGEETFGSLI